MSSNSSNSEESAEGVLSPRINENPPVHRLNSLLRTNDPTRADLGDDLRESLWMSTYEGDRNLFDALGYIKEPEYEHYRARYARTDIAPAIVDKLPKKAWAKPEINDTGATGEESTFENAVESFLEGEWTREDPIKVMQRASRMERLGQFSLIFLGLADENVAAEDAEPDDLEKSVDEDSLASMADGDGFAGDAGLQYITPYDQGRVDPEEIEWVTDDPTDPRFGMPESYQVDLGDERPTVQVHWERIIHIVGDVFDDELKSPSVLKQSLNRIDDIEKILGASAEGYWRSAYQGLVISPPEINGQQASFSDDGEGLHKQIQRYIQNMSREIFTGANIDTIDSSTEDPSGHLDSQYKPLASNHSIPQSILMGNETGERATTEDRAMWHERISEYREEFCKAQVLRPLIDRLIALNILPEPEGEYRIDWPAISEKSDKEEAEVASKIATAINKGTGGKPLKAMTIEEFRQEILGWKAERGGEVEDIEDTMESLTSEDLELDEEDERVQQLFEQAFADERVNEFDPEEHPRGPSGKFVEAPGGGLDDVVESMQSFVENSVEIEDEPSAESARLIASGFQEVLRRSDNLPKPDTIRFTDDIQGGGTNRAGTILVNSDEIDDPEAYASLAASLDESSRTGDASQVKSVPEIAVHEYGHILDKWLKLNTDSFRGYRDIRHELVKNVQSTAEGTPGDFKDGLDEHARMVSDYATTSPDEYFAEAFTAFISGRRSDVPDEAEAFFERVMELSKSGELEGYEWESGDLE